ncbi:MAG: hypothetical protein K2Q14_00660, partial [Gammaproteobacteria bacterium]|nr:hypothetical protein [Gammaproteobacteria bacterium]
IIGISIITFLGNNAWYPANFISTSTSMILLAILSLVTYVYGAFYALDHQPYVSHDASKIEAQSATE